MIMKKLLVLTGGSFAGRKLYVPASGVRPATNLVREAIFSTLFSFFEGGVRGLKILDLFAGTGSLGIEALSRGASSAVFVDKNRESIRSIRKNLEILGFTRGSSLQEGGGASWEVFGSDVISYLKRNRDLAFDLVFVDPPYRYTRTDEVVEQLIKSLVAWGAPGGNGAVLVYERFYDAQPPDYGPGAQLLKRKKYGQSEILYFKVQKGDVAS
jgi:16S rRNA (guanine966-N2)-methyltransferase